jgi:outer membrane protein TolC
MNYGETLTDFPPTFINQPIQKNNHQKMKSNLLKYFFRLLKKGAFIKFLAAFQFVSAAPADTTLRVLTVSEFMEIVKNYHPVAKQAQLILEQAKAKLLIARGGWDPDLYSNYKNKTYDGANYYSYFESKISVPVWYGIEVNTGYDLVNGQNINVENKLPPNGLGYLGISVSLLKNVLLDKQRATLKQALIFREASEQQRLVILNDLLYNALKTYYDWSYAYNEYLIYTEAVRIATIRYNATIQGVIYGDRAALDTTEALTQLQSRQFQLNDAKLRFLNNGLEINNYLWLNNNTPRPIDTTIVPMPLNTDFTQQQIQLNYLEDMAFELQQNHPILLNYNFKLRQLDIERRLKLESLKPTLNAKYNLLSEQFNFQSQAGILLSNNYYFGLNFSMPLTFMQGRGALRLTKLEIQNTRYEMNYKKQELLNKLRGTFNELITTQQQTKLYEQSVQGFKALFEGETIRLNNGESSLFLVNARENRLLDAQIKLCELQTKYFKTEAELKWAVGNINR